MEPLLWLASPFVITAVVVALIMWWQRSRPDDRQSLEEQRQVQLQRMARALHPPDQESSES